MAHYYGVVSNTKVYQLPCKNIEPKLWHCYPRVHPEELEKEIGRRIKKSDHGKVTDPALEPNRLI